MALTVDWPNGDIQVAKADMTLIQASPIEIRKLDTNQFRYDLRNLEDSEIGRPFPITHDHNKDVDIGGGVVLADVLLIRDPYTVTFEDGQYVVELEGTNNNINLKNNKNQVSVSSANSAGLVVISAGGGPTAQEFWEYLISGAGGLEAQEVLLKAMKKANIAAGNV